MAAIPGYLCALAGPTGLTAGILRLHTTAGGSAGYAYLYLGAVTLCALLFGLGPAIVAAVLSAALIDYFFVPPFGTLTIASGADIQNLTLFVLAALVVGILVETRRRQQRHAQELAESLRHSNAELERRREEAEKGRRAAIELASVSARVEALAQADRLKTELLANVSHQLRTPLGAIVGMSSALLDADGSNAGREKNNALRQYLEAINSEGRHLARLVDDLLEMARLESGNIELRVEPLDVLEALQWAADRARLLDPELKVTVSGSRGLALADDASVQEVLRNLIENASRYGESVELQSTAGEKVLRLSVADRGPGVAATERDVIFERFHQSPLDPGVQLRRPAGSGLGLAICRRLVDAMDGRIWFEPRPHGGSIFTFELPLYRPAPDLAEVRSQS
jgi:K+-sensing histidine kinase KdpD